MIPSTSYVAYYSEVSSTLVPGGAIRSPEPTKTQIAEAIEGIYKLIYNDQFVESDITSITRSFIRTGKVELRVPINLQHISMQSHKGFHVTRELLDRIQAEVGRFFQKFAFLEDLGGIRFPLEIYSCAFTLELYHPERLPALSPTASPSEQNLHSYLQRVAEAHFSFRTPRSRL